MRSAAIVGYLTRARPVWVKLLVLAVTLAATTVVRWYMDGGQAGAPFALYYPVVIITAVAFGACWAMGVVTISEPPRDCRRP